MNEKDHYWMQKALALAKQAAEQNEVPVGAVLVLDDQCIGQGFNQPISYCDPTAHAEINALRAGAKSLGNYRLLNTTLYVTLEPCLMCAGALVHARIKRLVFGAKDPKAGAIVSTMRALDFLHLNHHVVYESDLLAAECGSVLKQFFQIRRE